jgi:hypothetical protein
MTVQAILGTQEERTIEERLAALEEPPVAPTTTEVVPAPTPVVIEPTELQETVQAQVEDPKIAEAAQQVYTPLQTQPEQLLTGEGTQVGQVTQVPQQSISAPQMAPATEAEAAQQTPVAPIATSTISATTVDIAAQAAASQGTISPKALIQDPVQGVIREESLAVPAEGEMPREAFIQNQLARLLTGIEGGEVPAWAKPAVAIAEAELAARGVGKSHVARESLFNAVIQAAMPIAVGDAHTKQTEFLTNLNNRQQAVMFNASVMANMDLANASYSQKAQVANAQAFLQMDFANLNNEQRTNEINMQARQQVLLSDASAKNAAKQFNATSENQTKQFMANLSANIDKANADRTTTVSQFNSAQDQQRSMFEAGNVLEADKFTAQMNTQLAEFNSQMEFNRDQFNATNTIAIEQSNVAWRRRMNEIDTAGVNATNQSNAMNSFNLSNQALTMLWQEQRDAAQFVWQSSESELDRANRIAIAVMTNETMADKMDADNASALGGLAIDIWDRYQGTS